MKVIFVSGKKRSGKDTFASFLKEELESKGYRVETLHFADELKQMICKLMQVKCDTLERYKNKERPLSDTGGLTWRLLLQKFSDLVKELTDKFYFSDKLKERVDNLKNIDVVIIPDYRYPYESEPFKNYDCVFVKIKRDSVDNLDKHSSELALDNVVFPYEIANNRSKGKLRDKVKEFVGSVFK